jgi:ADP-heptose:LPS heptosyltransferase/GT2 family glycosyltransferase
VETWLLSFEEARLGDDGLLTLRGWAAGATPLVSLEASVDGVALGPVELHRARPDVEADHPEFVEAALSGFRLQARLDPEIAGAPEAVVTARFAGGEAREAAQPILRALSPLQADPEDSLLFNLDLAELDSRGEVYISGWAAHPDRVVAIELRLDGALLGEAELGGARPDVAEAHPQVPGAAASGFRWRGTGPARRPGEARLAFLFATEAGAALSRERAARVETAKPPTPRPEHAAPADAEEPFEDGLLFHFDIAEASDDGAVQVSGWAAHADVVERIEIGVDGATLGEATLGGERPDVAKAYPEIASARASGFRWRGRMSLQPGRRARIALRVSTRAGSMFAREREVEVEASKAPAAAPREGGEIRLNIDSPPIVAGAFVQPVGRSLTLEGWAAGRDGIAAIEVFLDDVGLGPAIRGLRRLDIGAAFPDWPDALLAGFAVQLPRKLFTRDKHVLRLEARDRRGQVKTVEVGVTAGATSDEDDPNALRARVSQAEIDLKSALIAAGACKPAFAVVLRSAAGAALADELAPTLLSLARQAGPEFRVVLAAPDPRAAAEAAEIAARVRFRLQIVETGAALEQAVARDAELWREAGAEPYLMMLRVGDRLGPDALLEFALEIATRPDLDFLYADDWRFDAGRGRQAVLLKPEWSPDLLLSTNYIGRAWTASLALVERAQLRLGDAVSGGDYDLVLRLTERATKIGRVPLVLAELGPVGDVEGKEILALSRAMTRRGVEGGLRNGPIPGLYRLRRRLRAKGLVSIVVPTAGARGLIETCILSIRKLTTYRRFEIVVVDNIQDETSRWKSWLAEHADRVVEDLSPFNWSALNNAGAKAARGEFLLFLNDDIEAIEGRWLHAMLEQAEREEVGLVGAKLVYPDGRVQHAGMFLSDQSGRHAFRYADQDDVGPFGLAAAEREVSSVTGACMLTRRDVFEALGGFDEAHAVVNNDLDFALRVRAAGKRVIYTPHARLVHHEMASRSELRDAFDESGFHGRWRSAFALGDPYFHPHLSREDADYSPDPEPTRVISAGRPIVARQDVKRILVQKLDHVGDFVTALPAIRRLQQRFPQAEIHLMAPTASLGLALLCPDIENVIEFNFFHQVSQNGRLEYAEEDLRELELRLRPYRFDIAIDLRKHTETRDILKLSGARVKAGYDLRGAFPWLDVALEWDGDAPYLPKRAQVSDDYVALVETVSLACERERGFLEPPPTSDSDAVLARLASFADVKPGLVERPLVLVHPAAGNVLRQWPPAHFAELIDLVVEAFEVNVALIGALAEQPIAAEVMAEIADKTRVWSLVGRTKLSDLPALVAGACLFVGNNSGPHHIAAALGTPTIGVHSGVVSADEWGPLGPKAVALQRRMICGPCYLDTPSRCGRGLACLKGLRAAEVFRVCEQMLGARLRRGAVAAISGAL